MWYHEQTHCKHRCGTGGFADGPDGHPGRGRPAEGTAAGTGVPGSGGGFRRGVSAFHQKIVERAVVAAERQNIVTDTHVGAGTVAGAAHEALEQMMEKAIGFNVGGKIGVARYGEHLCVAVYMSVGVLNLNELGVGLAHRSLAGID